MSSFPVSRLVETTYGPIVGRRLLHEGERKVDAFQGIPYARPPIGPLRFKKPQPPEPWTEVRECKNFGPRSIQKPFPGPPPPIPMSEDCLNLNVFTPVWEPSDPAGFPVFVYVHGGGFLFDSAYTYGDVNICENIVRKDVVAVTVQYRCGYLGLFTTGDHNCPGNNLLWDLTLALKWIVDNITRFNGNPKNITLIGQSAGGALVDLLSLSPHSRDLFHKVVSMAGNATDFWVISDTAIESCREAARKFGVTATDSIEILEGLRQLPAETFALGLEDTRLDEEQGLIIGPVIDGDFLPKSVIELRKEAPHKQRIIGVCRDEGLMWLGEGPGKQSQIEEVAKHRFPEKNFSNNYQQLRQEYIQKLNGNSNDEETLQRAIAQALGDNTFVIGCQENILDNLEFGHESVYVYLMDYFNEEMNAIVLDKAPFQGPTHCCDVSYLLGTGVLVPFKFTDDDKKMVNLISSYFTNFVKHGDPNGPGLTEWRAATKVNPESHLRITQKPQMEESFFEGRPRWLIEVTKKYRQ